jgi:hypothetical protein
MSVVTSVAKKAIRDKVTAEVNSAVAKLEALKAEAETIKADIEIKAITEILAKLRQPKK